MSKTPVARCRGCGGYLPRENTRFCGHCGCPVDLRAEVPTPDRAMRGQAAVRAATPAPILLTRRKRARPAELVAAGAMLGNDVDGSRGGSAGSARDEPELAHAATWLATIEAQPPPEGPLTPAGQFGVAVPAVVPPAGGAARGSFAAPADREDEDWPHFPGRVDVGEHTAHNFYCGFASDIRLGGLFVHTCAPFEIGEQLHVTFSVPGLAGCWSTRCVVQWSLPFETEGQGSVPGMGLRMLDSSPQVEAAINRFVKRREPIFYETAQH